MSRETDGESKVRDLSALAALLASHRAAGRRVVLCHGVFDLLHVGHVRHFVAAKKRGDLLVVTLTPDQYVNKGPHRPAFPQDLRAESIAALGCVDYVAINRWPTAVEAIELLRPDYYVKGREYRDENDSTGAIALEERAIKKVGGRVVFTDAIRFSSSQIINRHFSVFPAEVKEFLASFASRHSPETVLSHLDALRGLKVLVVGDTIIDEYHYCEAIGKSSKEPMLAVRRLSSEQFAGGILAVANHVSDFCDRVKLITLLGREESHESFIREKLAPTIESRMLHRSGGPTIVKRRFIESYFFTKMLEVYEMGEVGMTDGENEELCAALLEEVPRHDAVLVVDFGHGMMSQEAINIVCRNARFLAVNAQSNAANLGYHAITKYRRADYVCLSEAEIRLEARDRHGDLRSAMVRVARKMGCGRVSVTRGSNGCVCYGEDEGFFEIPALAGKVVDRIGAGDAFLALTAPCVARKTPTEVVGFIGNAVGAQAVATVGNRYPVRRASLYKQIESLLK